MARKLVYSGLVASLLCGCQSTKQTACCDDCLPPPSYCGTYNSYCDNFITTATAADCARSDLKDLRKSGGKRSQDFDSGFQQAYIDLAMGRLAQVPPIPPRQYWTAYYRSCAGSDAVNDWFEGYRLGLSMGSQNGVSHFNRVATSWQGNGLSADPVWHGEYGPMGHRQTIGAAPNLQKTTNGNVLAGNAAPLTPTPAVHPPATMSPVVSSGETPSPQRVSMTSAPGTRYAPPENLPPGQR